MYVYPFTLTFHRHIYTVERAHSIHMLLSPPINLSYSFNHVFFFLMLISTLSFFFMVKVFAKSIRKVPLGKNIESVKRKLVFIY